MKSQPQPISQPEASSRGSRALAATRTSIVCGTDFSENAVAAVDVAAALASRVREPLVLVHAADEQPRQNLPGELQDSLCLFARAQLHEERERLLGLDVELTEILRTGQPDDVFLREIGEQQARLLVLAPWKERSLARWWRGDPAVRIAEVSPIPTLIVRRAAPLLRWARGGRRLRVLVGADFSAPSEAALRWVGWLREVGACDVVVACLAPVLPPGPPEEYPQALAEDMILRSNQAQARAFRRRVRTLLGPLRTRVRIEADWGLSDAHLIHLASEERADLLVVGTHSRHGWRRLGHHSVSRGVLHYAPVNVACVPVGPAEIHAPEFREPQAVSDPEG